jgi:hypothetical protein
VVSNKIQHHKKRAFLAAYSETGNISKSAEIAEIDRSTHYEWLNTDADYKEAFEQAHEVAGDRLEQEARRRAVEGVEEPVFYKGEEVGTIRKYSDPLLIFLLKGAKPEKYKERTQNENKNDNTNVNVNTDIDLSKLSEKELESLERLAEKLAGSE